MRVVLPARRAAESAGCAAGSGAAGHARRGERWEARHGRIQPGDVPLLFSGYSDRYHRRFPQGDRFKDGMLWKPLVEKVQAKVQEQQAGIGCAFAFTQRGAAAVEASAPLEL